MTKKKTKRNTKPMKRRTQISITSRRSTKRYGALVVCLIVGLIGLWLLRGTFACSDNPCDPDTSTPYVANPPIAKACQAGLDIALLVDASGSMDDISGDMKITPFEYVKKAAVSFIKALEGQPIGFAIGKIDKPFIFPADGSSNPYRGSAEAISLIENMEIAGSSYLENLNDLAIHYDPRPNTQNLIIFLSDGEISYQTSNHNSIKAQGTRLLGIAAGTSNISTFITTVGPRVNTGSIWTSDVITTDFQDIEVVYKTLAKQLCQKPKAASTSKQGKDGDGTGDNGNGNGNKGNGTGTSGTGQGKTGSGDGGGGSSANKLGKAPNTVPKAAPQGSAEQEPPEQQPSPFFDGKQYAIGSDPDAQTPADLVQHPGKILNNVWFYILGGVVVAGGVGAGVVMWRKGLWVFGKRKQ